MTAVSRLTRLGENASPARKATNVTLSRDLPRDAKVLGLNISHACEQGLAAAVSRAREAEWLRENRAAIDAMNDYVEQHGIPLKEFRQF